MSKGSTTTWVVVIVVVILVIAGVWWWYSSQQSMTATPSSQTTTQSSDKSITSFNFSSLSPEVYGNVDNTNYTVNLTVPTGTDVTSLTPTITVADNATVSPSSGVSQDFTNPVTYMVTAQDGSMQNYTVTVTVGGTSTSTGASVSTSNGVNISAGTTGQ